MLPSSTATSRSPDIPIEHTSRPSRRPVSAPGGSRAAPPRCHPRWGRPSSARARSTRVRSPDRPARRPRPTSQPPLPGSPVVSTWISTRPPWCPLGDLVDHRRPVETAPDVDESDQLTNLVALEPPDEVHLGARVARWSHACRAVPGRSSRRWRRSPPATAAATASDSESLGHADHGDTVGPRPLDAVDAVRGARRRRRDVVGVDHGASNQTTSACRSSSARRRCERNRRSHPVHAPTTSSSMPRRARPAVTAAGTSSAACPSCVDPVTSARRRPDAVRPPVRGRRPRTRSSTDGCTARAPLRPPACRSTRARRRRRR